MRSNQFVAFALFMTPFMTYSAWAFDANRDVQGSADLSSTENSSDTYSLVNSAVDSNSGAQPDEIELFAGGHGGGGGGGHVGGGGGGGHVGGGGGGGFHPAPGGGGGFHPAPGGGGGFHPAPGGGHVGGGGGFHPAPGGGGGYHPAPGGGHVGPVYPAPGGGHVGPVYPAPGGGGGYHPVPVHPVPGGGPGYHQPAPGGGFHQPAPGYHQPVHYYPPYPVHGGYHHWPHWEHPYFPRPSYDYDWYRVRWVTCSAEDSQGYVYPVTEDTYYGYTYYERLEEIQDEALDRCYNESGGDPYCELLSCNVGY